MRHSEYAAQPILPRQCPLGIRNYYPVITLTFFTGYLKGAFNLLAGTRHS